MEKILTPLLVVAVALIGERGRILLQRRRLDRAEGGLWEFPGGKVEAGETAEAAILREIEEELGIVLDAATLAPLTFASGFAEGGSAERPLVILLYACRSWEGDPVCRDAEEISWFAPEELSGLAMPRLDYPLARALLAAIRADS